MRYELTDFEWIAIKSMLPNKPRGMPRVDDRRALNGIARTAARIKIEFSFLKGNLMVPAGPLPYLNRVR